MALLFIDGFDHYDPQALDALGQPMLARGKADILAASATRIQGRRPSSHALRLAAGPDGGYVKNLSGTRAGVTVGAALRVQSLPSDGNQPVLLGLRDASTLQITHTLALSSDARIMLYQRGQHGFGLGDLLATSIIAVPLRVWHYIELQVVQGTTNGSYTVRINGVQAIHLAAQNTLQGGGGLLTVFAGAMPGQPCHAQTDLDDLYIADTTGTINNTFLGDVRVDTLQAQANGALNQWTVSGAASAWQAVSDTSETTAINAATAGLRQTFDVAALPAMSSPAIHGVQVTALSRKTDAGMGQMRGLAVSGAQSAVSANISLQEQLAWHAALFERNPSGNVQWTEAALNAAEFGVESA